MGRVLINSFNHGHRAGDFGGFNNVTLGSGIADMEGLCAGVLGQSSYYQVVFGSKKAELYVRWLHKFDGTDGWYSFSFIEDSIGKVVLIWQSAPSSEFYLKVNSVDQKYSNGAHSFLSNNEPIWVELYFKAGTSTGQAKLWLNGELLIDFTGNVGTANGVNKLEFGTSGAQYPHAYHDHIVIDDANRIGHSKITGLFPAGIGSSAQFTPTPSPNWECVNESATTPSWAANLENDYNEVNSVDQKDLFATQDLPAEATGVKCVSLRTRVFKNGAPTPTNITPLIKTGGTEYSGDNLAGAAIPNHGNKIWDTNPNTTNPWTPTEVNDLEIGYKSAA